MLNTREVLSISPELHDVIQSAFGGSGVWMSDADTDALAVTIKALFMTATDRTQGEPLVRDQK